MTYPPSLVIGNSSSPLKIRRQMLGEYMNIAFISHLELNKIDEFLTESNWTETMQDELNKFKRNNVWFLVPRHNHPSIIGTRWAFRNKLNEDGTIVRNKARLVAQGFRQKEIIYFEETFALVV